MDILVKSRHPAIWHGINAMLCERKYEPQWIVGVVMSEQVGFPLAWLRWGMNGSAHCGNGACTVQAVSTLCNLIPTILLYHMGQFNDKLALFVFLAGFKGMFIFPPKSCLAAFTINISNCMKSSQEHPFFSWSTTDIYYRIEKVCTSLTPLEWLWY